VKTRHFDVELEDDVLVVVPGPGIGSLHDEIVDELRATLHDPLVADRDLRGVVVDFGRVDYFGSLMLEALRGLWNELQSLGLPLVLCSVRGVCREILGVTKFDLVWPILDTRQAALDAVLHRPVAAPPRG
jgi:anti-anti-sigma factor